MRRLAPTGAILISSGEVTNLLGLTRHPGKGLSALAANVLNMEVKGLLEKGNVSKVEHVHRQYVSPYFAEPKSTRSPDKWRPIQNLKKFTMYHSKWRN